MLQQLVPHSVSDAKMEYSGPSSASLLPCLLLLQQQQQPAPLVTSILSALSMLYCLRLTGWICYAAEVTREHAQIMAVNDFPYISAIYP